MSRKSGKRKISARKAREIQDQNRIERLAALGTGLIFIALFAAFLFLSLSSSVPEPQQKGVQVMLGENRTGMTQQLKEIKESTDKKAKAEELKTPEAEKSSQTQEAQSSSENAAKAPDKSSVTQDQQAAPQMKETENQEKKPEKEKQPKESATDKGEGKAEKNTTKKERKPDEEALFTSGDDSKGKKDEPGKQGKKTGDKSVDEPNPKGKAKQDEQGISFSLEGRSITKYPDVKDQSQKYGRVVVEITVNEQGEVIKAEPGQRGSTVTDSRLKRLAKKAALQTEFNANPKGPSRQIGKMTINFKLK
jgi:TonB family protein